jgi:hypothetical protein
MKQWHQKLFKTPHRLPVPRWVEADFPVAIRSEPGVPGPAPARRRHSEGQIRIQNKITAWSPVATNTAVSNSVEVIDTFQVGSLRFYRVGRLPNP